MQSKKERYKRLCQEYERVHERDVAKITELQQRMQESPRFGRQEDVYQQIRRKSRSKSRTTIERSERKERSKSKSKDKKMQSQSSKSLRNSRLY
ncbi:hypothetical protein FGO68_gene17702 [Halteria grandinella]|uniref:Uncharacterized protein n=1 Tax=Halteria grandinella TaxID=5974 RepID=A0A8J8NVX4_HALGN|nr:hypothetical protein FGO68_gene17702 [Halteria grandinella]